MQTDQGREHHGRDPRNTVTPFPIPARIPVFPLPNVVLFPKTYLPLHIFEPRYRAMVSDAAISGQCIGMALLKDGWETDYYGHPPVFPVGCVGRLASVQSLADGRSNILLQGLERFEIEREWYDNAYREATISVTVRGTEASLDPMVRRRLFSFLESYLQSRDDVPTWQEIFREEVSDEIIVNTLSTYLECTPLEKQFLLEADSLHQQARRLSDLIEFMIHDRSGCEGLGLMDRAIAIQVSHLTKTYDGHTAVSDLSFQVYAGEIFGLLGPNGAGKSTTLRTLITLLTPTSGTASVLGHDTVREADAVRKLIGYVPQERAIDRFLTGREHLELLGALYHLPKAEATKRIAELLKLVELEEPADRPAKTYSGGMKRKLDIACGLLPDPKILFLDEPTLGLGCAEPAPDLGLRADVEGAWHDDRHDDELFGRGRPALRPVGHHRRGKDQDARIAD